MINLWKQEPIRLYAAFVAIVNLLVLFGVELTAAQLAGLNSAFAAFLGLIIRNRVTPKGSIKPPFET